MLSSKRVTLFKIFGFAIRLDFSWFFLAVLITWSLATAFFPSYYPGFSTRLYWMMGAIGAFGLFFSILFHELCHSIVARKYTIRIKGITLFLFGGVAEMIDEPPSPKSEFWMAIAGPISSYVLAALFYLLHFMNFGVMWVGIVLYLAFINTLLATFNLIPAFPLDGGRVFRALLWQWKGNLQKATYISSKVGSIFAYILMGLGIFSILGGNLIGGIWWIFIGFFLLNASRMGYQHVLMRQTLYGESIMRFITKDPVTVPPQLSISELVENYIYRHHFKFFPVVDSSHHLLGCISTRLIHGISRDQWPHMTVREAMIPPTSENTLSSRTDTMYALMKMNSTGNSRMLVVENGELKGIVSLKDILRFFTLKVDLEGGER